MECQRPTLLEVVSVPRLLAFDCRRIDHQDEELDTSVVIVHQRGIRLPLLLARTIFNLEVETSEELSLPSLSSI